PYVGYIDDIQSPSSRTKRFVVKRYNGSIWEHVGAEAISEFTTEPEQITFPRMAFTVYEGRPYVIHTDKEYRKFILKKFNGSNIKYDGNGAAFGSVPVDLNAYRDGESVTVQGNTGGLGKTGYTFAGWNTAAD